MSARVLVAAGLNATDMQCATLLLLYGPATPGELAGLAGLTAGGAITEQDERRGGDRNGGRWFDGHGVV